MPRGTRDGIVIAGGGAAGCLAALAMARLRPDVPLLIVEEGPRFGGAAPRTLFAEGLDAPLCALAEALAASRWPGFYLAFPGFSRKLKADLFGFDPAALHAAMVATLDPRQYRLDTKVVAVRADALVLDGGEELKAQGAIDARGAANLSMLELLHEARLERDCRLAAPHGLDRPVLIDATAGRDGLSWVQLLPLGADRLTIAEATVSERAQIDGEASARIDAYVARRGWRIAAIEAERAFARPLPTGGDFAAFWRIGGARVAKLGLRGGFFDPLGGPSAADALANAARLAAQRDFSGAALHDVFEGQARQLWRRRAFRRETNAAFVAAPAEARGDMLARLAALDPGPVVRFLADRMGMGDRKRVQRALRG
jgi:lycopene beta-cyclase